MHPERLNHASGSLMPREATRDSQPLDRKCACARVFLFSPVPFSLSVGCARRATHLKIRPHSACAMTRRLISQRRAVGRRTLFFSRREMTQRTPRIHCQVSLRTPQTCDLRLTRFQLDRQCALKWTAMKIFCLLMMEN